MTNRPQANPTPDAPDATRRRLVAWLWRLPVLAAVGAAGWGAWEAYRVHFSRAVPSDAPSFTPHPPERIGSVADFPEPWSALEFTFAGTAALALRLPEPVPGGLSEGDIHLAAFSRLCTHLGCPVSLNRNLEAVAVAFNHRSDHPVLTCPCHLSVFAPLQAGRAVSGPASDPLPRVQLSLQGGELFAVGLEAPR
jgi:arsenite oxidase small subunit